jgi:hypothetical protein
MVSDGTSFDAFVAERRIRAVGAALGFAGHGRDRHDGRGSRPLVRGAGQRRVLAHALQHRRTPRAGGGVRGRVTSRDNTGRSGFLGRHARVVWTGATRFLPSSSPNSRRSIKLLRSFEPSSGRGYWSPARGTCGGAPRFDTRTRNPVPKRAPRRRLTGLIDDRPIGATTDEETNGNPVGGTAPSRSRSWWKTIDRALEAGQAPRCVVRRYAELNRKALTHHLDGYLAATCVAKAGMLSARSTRRKA